MNSNSLLKNIKKGIKVVNNITPAEFQTYHNNKQPILLKGYVSKWQAIKQWEDMEWWIERHGKVMIPVELARYDLIQDKVEIPLELYIKLFIQNQKQYAYFAQYPILDFIPELKSYLDIHDISRLTNKLEQTMIWFGPKDTITPIHFDPYFNLYAQIVGKKYFRLFNPDQKEYLYPYEDRLLINTSKVDLENIDLNKFPKFNQAQYLDVIAEEGDVLFIPKGWWHYVKSLERSISLSFWFK